MMKKLAISTIAALTLSLATVPAAHAQEEPATATQGSSFSDLSSGGTRTADDYKDALGGVKEVWTTILAIAVVAGTLAILGKTGTDIAQQLAKK